MQVQLNTDNNFTAREDLAARIDGMLQDALHRFRDKLTRVEVYLKDENSTKGGDRDKECTLEARPRGLPPITVTSKGADVPVALDGAIGKLTRALDRQFGKLEVVRGKSGPEPLPEAE